MRRAKALPDCICNLPCTAVGTRLLWRLVTAKVLRSSTSNNESGDGLKCLSKLCRGRDGPLRRSVRLLPWPEDASVHHARGLAVSGLMSLQRACLLRAALERLPREVALNMVCSQRLAAFWMVCAARVSSNKSSAFRVAVRRNVLSL